MHVNSDWNSRFQARMELPLLYACHRCIAKKGIGLLSRESRLNAAILVDNEIHKNFAPSFRIRHLFWVIGPELVGNHGQGIARR